MTELEKYNEIMKWARLVVPANKNQHDLSQPSPLEVVDSYTTDKCSDVYNYMIILNILCC